MGLDLEGIMLDEKSHTEKDKYCMFSLICGINIIKSITKKKQSHKENKLVVTRRER